MRSVTSPASFIAALSLTLLFGCPPEEQQVQADDGVTHTSASNEGRSKRVRPDTEENAEPKGRPSSTSSPTALPSYESHYKRDAEGFTILEPVTKGPKKTRKIYVSSSSGSDSNDGLSPKRPLRSWKAGLSKLRDGYPDWLLLMRGDTFEGNIWINRLSGMARGKPMVITAYGEGPRPVIQAGAGSGIGFHPNLVHEHFAVVGLSFVAQTRDPSHPRFNRGAEHFNDSAGVNGTTKGGDILIEDNTFQYFAQGGIFQDVSGGKLKDVEFRRNGVYDIWVDGKGFSQGLYLFNVDGILLEENLIDTAGHLPRAGREGSMFDHSVYLQNGTNGARTVVRGNIFARADGIQMREGGLAEDNLFYNTWIALHCGGGNEANEDGVVCILEDNVILGGGNINKDEPRGWGLRLMNLRAPSRAARTVIAHNEHGGFPQPLQITGSDTDDDGTPMTVRSITLKDIVVYDWGGGLLFKGGPEHIQHLEMEDVVVQSQAEDPLIVHMPMDQLAKVKARNVRLFSSKRDQNYVVGTEAGPLDFDDWKDSVGDQRVTFGRTRFQDPGRDLDRYAKEVAGLPDAEALLEKARGMPHGPEAEKLRAKNITKWIRAGFRRK